MRAILNITRKWSIPYVLKPNIYSKLQVRKCSKKITQPPLQVQKNEDKSNNYLYTIPPWMKKDIKGKSNIHVENKQVNLTESDNLKSNKNNISSHMKLKEIKDNSSIKEVKINKLTSSKDSNGSNTMKSQFKKDNIYSTEFKNNNLTLKKDLQTNNYKQSLEKTCNDNKEVNISSNFLKTRSNNEDSTTGILPKSNELKTFINQMQTNATNTDKKQPNKSKKDSKTTQIELNSNEVNYNNLAVNKDLQTNNYKQSQEKTCNDNKEVNISSHFLKTRSNISEDSTTGVLPKSNELKTFINQMQTNATNTDKKQPNKSKKDSKTTQIELNSNEVNYNNLAVNKDLQTNNYKQSQEKTCNDNKEVNISSHFLKTRSNISEDSATGVLPRSNELKTFINQMQTNATNTDKKQPNKSKKGSKTTEIKLNSNEVNYNNLAVNKGLQTNNYKQSQEKTCNDNKEVNISSHFLKARSNISEDSTTGVLPKTNQIQTFINQMQTNAINKEKKQLNKSKKDSKNTQIKLNSNEVNNNNNLALNKDLQTNKQLQSLEKTCNDNKEVNILKTRSKTNEDSAIGVLLRSNQLLTFRNQMQTNVPSKEKKQSNISKKDSKTTKTKLNRNEVSNNKFTLNTDVQKNDHKKSLGKTDRDIKEVKGSQNFLKTRPKINEDSATGVLRKSNQLQTFNNQMQTNATNKNKKQPNKSKKDSKITQIKLNEEKNKINSIVQSKLNNKLANKNRNNLKTFKTLKTKPLAEKVVFKNLSNGQEQGNFIKNSSNKKLEMSDIISANSVKKVQLEKNKPKYLNVKLGVKSIELTDKKENFPKTKLLHSKTKSDKMIAIKETKVNDILKQEISKRKEKLNTIKKAESEIFKLNFKKDVSPKISERNEDVSNVTDNMQNIDSEIHMTVSKINEKKKLNKTHLGGKEEHAVIKLTSNPLGLNTKESLFASQKNEEKLQDSVTKNDEVKTKKETPVKNITSMKIKVQTFKRKLNKLNSIYQRLNNSSSRSKIENSVHKDVKRDNIATNVNRYNEFSVEKTKQFFQNNTAGSMKRNNELAAHKIKQFSQFEDKDLKAKQKNKKMNKSKVGTNIVKKKSVAIITDSVKHNKESNLEKLNAIGKRKVQVNAQNEWFKNIKNITPKQPLQFLTIEHSNYPNKKPIFISNKPVLKINKMKLNSKNCIVNLKKLRPVFGPPICNHRKQNNLEQGNTNSFDGCNNNNDNNNNNNNDDDNNGREDNKKYVKGTSCVNETKGNVEKSTDKDTSAPSEQCVPSENNQQLISQFYKYLNNFKELIICYYKKWQSAQRRSQFFNSQTNNKPIDNLNVSLLRTNGKKQPIYICDKCSYLFKYPTIYQKLFKNLRTFSHLIKTKEKKDLNTITGIPLVKCKTTSKRNLKASCIKKRKKLDTLGTKVTSCPKKSYSEILTNLLTNDKFTTKL